MYIPYHTIGQHCHLALRHTLPHRGQDRSCLAEENAHLSTTVGVLQKDLEAASIRLEASEEQQRDAAHVAKVGAVRQGQLAAA